MNSKLFFVPYAGGSSVTFKHWIKYLQPEVELKIFEMAGHGGRISNACYNSVAEAGNDFYNFLKNNITADDNYFLAGHCMGAVILYETCILINQKKEFSLPKHIFISGHGSMEYIHNENHVNEMDSTDIINFFINEGGMSEEYMNEELLELILPAIKADVKIYEEYVFNKDRNIPKLDMTVLYGEHDVKTPENEISAWREYSEKIDFVSFDDGHYFLNNQSKKYLDLIKERIMEVSDVR